VVESWSLERAARSLAATLRSAVETRNTNNPGMWQVNFTLSPTKRYADSAHSRAKPGTPAGHCSHSRVYSDSCDQWPPLMIRFDRREIQPGERT